MDCDKRYNPTRSLDPRLRGDDRRERGDDTMEAKDGGAGVTEGRQRMTKKKTDHDDTAVPSTSSHRLSSVQAGQVLRKRAESQREAALEALRESEERFRIALKNSPIVVFNQDRELRYTWICNPHPGFDPQAVLGKTDAELLPADDAACLTEIKRRVLETGVTAREEVKTTIDGQAFFYDLTVEPLHAQSGNITGVTCVSIDITERKKTEEESKKSSQLLRDTGEMAKVGGWEFDLATNEVSWTEEVGRIHGVEPGYKPKLEEAVISLRPNPGQL